ncbi:AMP-binding protein [Escherichia coli]
MPDKIAVVDNHGASYTYSALDHATSCLANWMLAKGIESGDRIAFQLPGWYDYRYLFCLPENRCGFRCRCLPGGKQTGMGAG